MNNNKIRCLICKTLHNKNENGTTRVYSDCPCDGTICPICETAHIVMPINYAPKKLKPYSLPVLKERKWTKLNFTSA